MFIVGGVGLDGSFGLFFNNNLLFAVTWADAAAAAEAVGVFDNCAAAAAAACAKMLRASGVDKNCSSALRVGRCSPALVELEVLVWMGCKWE